MAAKREQFTLQFNADTSQAKRAMQELNNSLSQLYQAQSSKGFADLGINKAVESAKELERHLSAAVNVNTGKLNLSDFQKSIQSSGTSLKELSVNLLNAGSTGQQVFLSMTQAIAQSEVPLKQMNKTIKDFGQTLKNTVKWEISSNVVHGLESALSGAVSYVKNLNTSLNDIRIVTGQSADDMARFAVQANKAARELSTTTKAYADASLIYYQQGDNQEQAAKKAAITIKAANSSFNTSAAEMSEYLTAVWNSYQVGADELERYVDIMAALGAKTATSLEEIATSMQKVAATSNTVGVSMEQVSSIIATVSSVTRESAESIGTSYKTIFARIGDLKLGDTLEDGVNLGQVSSQLDKIGVKILDANGEMRDMGVIIEDLGEKWQTLGRAEQTAIAQVVAGKRQYTQLMALFENWDMYQENMSIAGSAEGSLQEMADTQAESVEAASKRMQAALEELYSKFINDQSIITFTKAMTGVVDAVSSVIDAFGGLPGILGNVGAIAIRVFGKDIQGSIDKTIAKISVFMRQFTGANTFSKITSGIKTTLSGKAKSVSQIEAEQNIERTKQELNTQKSQVYSASGKFALEEAESLLDYKQQLINIEHELTEAQKATAQSELNNLAQQQAALTKLKADKEEMLKQDKQESTASKLAIIGAHSKKVTDSESGKEQKLTYKEKQQRIESAVSNEFASGDYNLIDEKDIATIDTAIQKAKALGAEMQKTTQATILVNSSDIEETGKDFDELKAKIETLLGKPLKAECLTGLKKELNEMSGDIEEAQGQLRDLVSNAAGKMGEINVGKEFEKGLDEAFSRGAAEQSLEFEIDFKTNKLEDFKKKVGEALNPESQTYSAISKFMTDAAAAASSLTAGLSTGSSLVATMKDETAGLADKMEVVAGSVATLATGFTTGGLIGLAASFVGILISGITTFIQKEEEARKKIAEENKARADEINEGNKAELDNIKNLLNTYNELYARYQAGENVQDQLKTSALDLAKAYGLTSASVAAMTGNFELFNKEVAETLNFADQMSDAGVALSNAGQVVTGSKNIGKVSVDMTDYLGVYTDMDNANAYIAATTQEDALLSQATALKTTDSVTWDFINEIYRQQGQMEDWSLASTHMLDAFIEFASQEASNYKEAFNMALEKYGLEDTKITATTARDKILDTLKGADINIGDFLQAFYSNALLRGSEEFNLANMGYSLAEIKSEDLGDKIMYGANSAAFQMSSMENLDMEAFKNIAFSQSGLKNLQEANSTNNFALDKIWNNFTDLYDSETGEFRWDDNLNAEDTVALYDKYVAWKDYLQKMLDNIVDTNSTEYQIISQFLTGVEKITDSEELSGAVSTYKEAQKNLLQWQLIQNSIQNSIGKSEEDTSFTDYITFQKSLVESVDKQYTTFDSLKEFSQEDVTNLTDEYVKAREKVIAQLISEFTAFDDYTTMYSALSMSFDDTQMGVISELIDAENLAASDITYNFIEALKTYFTSVGEGAIITAQDLQDNTVIQSTIRMNKAATAYNTNKTGRETAIAQESSFKQDMTQAEAETFYSNYWGNEQMRQFLTDRGKPLKEWTEFIKDDYETQEAYIKSISAEYTAATQDSAQEIIDAHAQYVKDMEGQLSGEAKKLYGDGGQTAQNNYAAWETFDSLYTETDGKYMDGEGNTFDTREAAFQNFLNLEGIQLGDSENINFASWEEFANIMAQLNAESVQYENAVISINASSLVGKKSIDEVNIAINKSNEIISDLENNLNALNSIDIDKIPEKGTQAYDALTESLGKTNKTMADYEKMSKKERIQEITKAKKEKLEAQKTEQLAIAAQYASNYTEHDFTNTNRDTIYATQDENVIAAYEAWLDAQQKAADLADQVVEETNNEAEQLIQLGAANTDAAIARFQQEQDKLKSAADKLTTASNILSSHIDGSTLSLEEQAQLNPEVLKHWKSLTTEVERAQYAAEQTAAAYQKQMEYQKNINDSINDAKTFMYGKGYSSSLLSNSNLYKDLPSFKKFLDDSNVADDVRAVLEQAYNTVDSQLGDNATITEWGTKMRAELASMGNEGANLLNILEASSKDAIVAIFQDFSTEVQKEAQDAANAWIESFNSIDEARKKLMQGGSLLEDIAGNPEKFKEYFEAYRKTAGNEQKTAEEFLNAVIQGQVTYDQLQRPLYDMQKTNKKKEYGLDIGIDENGDVNKANNFGYTSVEKDKDLIAAKMYNGSTFQALSAEDKTNVLTQLKGYYTNLLTDSLEGVDATEAGNMAQAIIDGLANADYSKIQEAAILQNSIIDNSYVGLEKQTTKEEAMTLADEAIENYNKTVEKESENQADWEAVRKILETKSAEENLYDAISRQDEELLSRLESKGVTAEQLNDMSLNDVQQKIHNAVIQIDAAKDSLGTSLSGVKTGGDVEGLTAEEREKYDEAWENAQVTASTSQYKYSNMATPKPLNANESFEYLQGLESQFKSLDAFETEATAENLLALRDALDMTNPLIQEYYSALASAETADEREYAIDRITEAILKQNDVTLTASQSSELLLKSYKENYGITDEYGEALSVIGVNALKVSKNYQKLTKEQLKIQKSFQKMNKQIKDGNKNIKFANKEYNNLTELYQDIAKAAKKSGKSIKDVSKDIQGVTEEEREVLEEASEEYADIFDIMRTDLGDTFSTLPQSLQDSINNCDLDSLISNLLSPMSFETLLGNIDASSAEVQTAIQDMANSSDSAIRKMGQQLQLAAEGNADINMGAVINSMGVDLSNPIEVLNALLQLYSLLSGIPVLTGAGSLIGPIQSGLSEAQALQGRYGGGGRARNANTQKPSGGGGGSKNKTKKDKLRAEDEIERYHEQNEVIERVGQELDKLSKLKERAYGKKYLDALDQETQALEDQLAAQLALHDEAEKWLAADRADLEAGGAIFNADGTISNYEDIVQRAMEEYNAAVDRFNNSDQGEGDELALEAAKQKYDDFIKSIENYEEALDIANESANEMLEIQNQMSELEVEKITYELELKTDMNERDLELLEYYQDKYADDLGKQDEAYNTILGSMLEYEDNLAALGQAYNDLNEKKAQGLINDADYAEALEELQSQIIDNLSELNEIQEQLAETYANTLDLATEEISKVTDALNSQNSVLQSYIDIMNLTGHPVDHRQLTTFYDKMNQNNLDKIQQQRDLLAALEAEEEKRFKSKIRNGEELTDLEKEQYDALQEKIQETREGLVGSTQEALELVRTIYETTITGIADELDSFMAGSAGSMAYLQEQYGYFQEEQSRYVSTAKELYEVSKLNRDIEGTLGETTSKAAKEALKALQEKINKQSELNELTEYDIEMNQLQYELLLARIKLEEAQNAKDVVRLTRDDNGNYAYRYTANQDKIDEAAQNYEDVLQQINESTAQRTSEIEQQLLDTMANYKDKFQEIATDYSLTEEERLMRLEELNSQYAETMQYLQEQNGIATENLTANQQAIAEHYGVSLSEITASTAGNVNDTVQSMIDKTQDYINAMNAAIFGEEGAQTAWQQYLAGIGDIEDAADLAYGNMVDNAEEMGEMNGWSAEQAQEVIDTLTDTLEPLDELTDAWNAHNEILETTISDYEDLAEIIQGTLSAIGEIPNITGTGSADGTSTPPTTTRSGGTLPATAAGGRAGSVMASAIEVLEDYATLAETVGYDMPGEMIQAVEGYEDTLQRIPVEIQEFQSGGLDSNLLTNIADSIKFAAEAMLKALDGFYHAFTGTALPNMEKIPLDQNVQISAEFPNVTDHLEVEEALLSLTNQASQFANRKK